MGSPSLRSVSVIAAGRRNRIEAGIATMHNGSTQARKRLPGWRARKDQDGGEQQQLRYEEQDDDDARLAVQDAIARAWHLGVPHDRPARRAARTQMSDGHERQCEGSGETQYPKQDRQACAPLHPRTVVTRRIWRMSTDVQLDARTPGIG